jgi:stage III sporulation protein AG
MKSWLASLRSKLHGENGLRIIVILGAAGIALILLSGMLPDKKRNSQTVQQPAVSETAHDTDRYRETLEERLTALLSQMDGIRSVKVMVTLSGSAEQIYAEEVKQSRNDRGTQTESACVITKSGGNEAAVIAETKYPTVTGVAVLCTAGDHAAVRERVSQAVATVLGIPASNVFVGKSGTI